MGTPARPYTGFVAKTACPKCAQEGKVVALQSRGSSGHACVNGHVYQDPNVLREDLERVRPAPIRGTSTKIVLPGQCKVEVIIKETAREALHKKYGERLEAVVAGHLAALCEDCVVFAGDDLKMLRDGLGERSGTAFELAAKAKNMRNEVAQASARVTADSGTAVMDGPGTFRVRLSDAHTKQVQELAKARNLPASEVLTLGIQWNLDSNNM